MLSIVRNSLTKLSIIIHTIKKEIGQWLMKEVSLSNLEKTNQKRLSPKMIVNNQI